MRWVRPLISLMMASGVLYGFIIKLIEPKDFLIIAAGAVGWWYISRDKSKKNGHL